MKARFTYAARETDNLMDYAMEGQKRYTALWKWQWKVANDNVKKQFP